MKNIISSIATILFGIVLMALVIPTEINAQDPANVDSKHYTIEFENDHVRVLRITYGPGEESVMHEHPNAVVVMLTDTSTEMTLPDGNKVEDLAKMGDAQWTPAGMHIPKNIGNEKMEAVLVELKSKSE
ncbi:MAG: hypothetical protein KJN85_06305 [Maribacter sp.]|jgi:quercetin dioxygenase-like cupin family protein|nr:hypothetical protein [Maribacter sp.]MBT8313397.1 hypothetical protein [Maribacter sp.]NNK19385.1 hypothetical protein [Maribacter sp.]